MMNNECFLSSENQVFAIQNWYLRKDEFDVMILDPLDTQAMGTYSKLCGKGFSSQEIFKKLYPGVPHKPKEKVLVDIDILTKEQLIHLISIRLNVSLPTFMYMSTEDLKSLYSVLSTKFDSLRWVNHN